jgi:hypothetical protein
VLKALATGAALLRENISAFGDLLAILLGQDTPSSARRRARVLLPAMLGISTIAGKLCAAQKARSRDLSNPAAV